MVLDIYIKRSPIEGHLKQTYLKQGLPFLKTKTFRSQRSESSEERERENTAHTKDGRTALKRVPGGGRGGGVLLGILGGGVPPGSSIPDPISDQKM